MLNRLYIFGAGGHAKSALDILIDNEENLEITVVDKGATEAILGFQVLPESALFEKAEDGKIFFHIAIGDNTIRRAIAEKCLDYGYFPYSIVSKRAYVSKFAKLGRGTFIGEGVHIGPSASIGDFSIINTHTHIDHDVEIGAYTQLAPGVSVGGSTKLGRNSFVGISTAIIDRLRITDDVIIGSQSLVNKDIVTAGTYLGTPIRLLER